MAWNPTHKSAPIVLTNFNLTARSVGVGVQQGVRSDTSKASGKFYFEITYNIINFTASIGICDSAFAVDTAGLGTDFNGIGYIPGSAATPQAIYLGNLLLSVGSVLDVSGAICSVAVDFTNQLIWVTSPHMRVQASITNTWNNSSTANPATGVGGISFSLIPGPYFVVFSDFSGGAQITANFGSQNFNRPIPAGFAPWDTTVAPPPAPPVPPPVSPPVPPVPPVVNAAALLPAGYLNINGNQIIDSNNKYVRIAAVAWTTINQDIPSSLSNMIVAGFNTVQVQFTNATITSDILIINQVVAAASNLGMKVIIVNQNNEGGTIQQKNGLWYDVGGVSDGTNGAGVFGTVNDIRFVNDWITIANLYKNTTTVIGYDIRNEPLSYTGMCTWQAGATNPDQNLRYMYERVGAAIQGIDAGKLIICEGPQNYLASFSGGGPAPWGDLSVAASLPVNLLIPNKLLYSVHDFPNSISGFIPDSGPLTIGMMNNSWGYLVSQTIIPVSVGAMGSSSPEAAEAAWAQTLLSYLNGQMGSQGGPIFSGAMQGISTTWDSWGNLPGSSPDGTLNTDGSLRTDQYDTYSQLAFVPKVGSGGIPPAPSPVPAPVPIPPPAPPGPPSLNVPTTFNNGPMPINMTMLSTNTTLILTWAPGVFTGQPVTYLVQYCLFCDFNWTTLSVISAENVVKFVIAGLNPNSFYKVRINANGSRWCIMLTGNTQIGGQTDSYDGDIRFLIDEEYVILGGASHPLVATDHTRYTLIEVPQDNYKIAVNGQLDFSSSRVIQLLYKNGIVYQQVKSQKWYSKVLLADSWISTSDPRINPPISGNFPATYQILENAPASVSTTIYGLVASGMQISYLFWGDYWTTNSFSADIIVSMNNLYASAYFTGLQEYGILAKPRIVQNITLTNSVAGVPPDVVRQSQIAAFLETLFATGVLTKPSDDLQMYMVIMPPSTVGSYNNLYTDPQGRPIVFGHVSIRDGSLDSITLELTATTVNAMTNYYVDGWLSTGDTSVSGFTPLVEIADFNNDTMGVLFAGTFVPGFYSNIANAVIVPTSEAAFPSFPGPTPPPVTPPTNVPADTGLMTAFWGALANEVLTNQDIFMGINILTGDPQSVTGQPDMGVIGTPAMGAINTIFKNLPKSN